MNKKIIKYLFVLLGLLILSLKLYLATNGYQHIIYGYDTPRTMSTITETISNETIEHFSSPQSALFIYFTSAVKLIAGISAVDMLFVPLLLITFLGFFLIYILAKEMFRDKNIAIFASILYAVSTLIQLATSSNLLFFITLPLFFIILLKYLKKEVNLLPLILSSEALYLSYPSIPYVVFSIVSMFFFFKLINAINENSNSSVISRYADFFIILPIVFISSYYVSKYLTIIEYADIVSYLNRTLGIWRGDLPKYFYIIMFIISVFLSLIAFLSQFYVEKLKFLVTYLIDWQNSIIKFFRKFPSKLNYLFIFIFILGVLDLIMIFFIKNTESEFYSLNKFLLKDFIGGELWRIIFFSISIFLISLPAIFFFFYKKRKLLDQHLIPILLFIILIFTGAIPFMRELLGPFYGDRGYRSIMLYAIILFSAFIVMLAKNKSLHKYLTIFITIVFSTSLIASFVGIKNLYDKKPNIEFIKDMKFLEKTLDSNSIFYLTRGQFKSDISAPTKFYSFSFIHSDIPFESMVRVNEENLIMNDFDEFVKILNKSKTKYIITEPNFELEKTKKIEKITTKLYSNDKGVSVYFLNNINL
ncbi:MAG: hypothetical protein UR27_C0017G0004 [Candidatus Peregrinibacteria bacterium GW2011_GWA2_33_10]|nr:MAG: hypothetical protein UR27_C0017G0004 [Candidatus Peregrinibacteria bacterium GW2011_GWA2_33_10]KKP41115.1 MAG: hypothetical protein UR30_C0002G0149 [Candidatus Peregrinibacteria bacterium GW2011_GWC2_33_13]OGJ47542.1 MAG: hypothetical protein A2229_00990 [Candidatus Peregrinibacteria bacterium RIFOXYA2_FULL_33_7]